MKIWLKNLKNSNVGQWYSKVKRMSQLDPTKEEKTLVENISNQTSEKQAEIIADEFAKIWILIMTMKIMQFWLN